MTMTLNGESVKIELFDVMNSIWQARAQRFLFKGADACVLLYDIGNQQSFKSITAWKALLQEQLFVDSRFPVLLFGNKTD